MKKKKEEKNKMAFIRLDTRLFSRTRPIDELYHREFRICDINYSWLYKIIKCLYTLISWINS